MPNLLNNNQQNYKSKKKLYKNLLKQNQFKCKICSKQFSHNGSWFKKHILQCRNSQKSQICQTQTNEVETNLLSMLPFYNDEDINRQSQVNIPYIFKSHLDIFCEFNKNKQFSILHLNVASLISKIDEIKQILMNREFDVICLNETKIDCNIPNKFFISKYYKCIRRDRTNNGGGILIYIKKEYSILKQEASLDFEIIYFQILIKNSLCNFICGYNPQNKFSKEFNNHLESNFLLSINLDQNLFIIGDLNQDLLSEQGKYLKNLISDYNLKNYILEPTRVVTVYSNKKNDYRTSRSLIDVIIHNNDVIQNSIVVNCSFSDHKFICCKLKIEALPPEDSFAYLRRLNETNLRKTNQLIEQADFSLVFDYPCLKQKWKYLKETVLEITNKIAPLKKIKLQHKDQNAAWFDAEMKTELKQKDYLYNKAVELDNEIDWINFKDKRRYCKNIANL